MGAVITNEQLLELRRERAVTGDLCLWSDTVVRVREVGPRYSIVEQLPDGVYQRAYTDSLVVISREPPDIKAMTLPDRRRELIENISSHIKSGLSYDDCYLLNRLLHMLKGNDDNIPKWFSQSVASSADDSRQISWAAEPCYFDDDVRRKRARPKGFLQAMNRLFDNYWTSGDITRLTYLLGEALPARDAYTFDVVYGQEVYDWYQDSDGPETCMRGRSYPRLYANNPDTVGLVVIRRSGDFFGRALLWKTDQGTVFMDRIYPNHGIHVTMLKRWADGQGWDYLDNQGYGQSVSANGNYYTVTLKHHTLRFPYMDTFRYSDSPDISTDDPIKLHMNDDTLRSFGRNGCYHYKFNNTDGTFEHDGSICERYDHEDCEYRYCGWYEDGRDNDDDSDEEYDDDE